MSKPQPATMRHAGTTMLQHKIHGTTMTNSLSRVEGNHACRKVIHHLLILRLEEQW